MDTKPPESHPLSVKWRLEAEDWDRRGQLAQAAMARSFADELDKYDRKRGLDELTLREAAAESGRHADTIARYIAEGELENVGKKGSPLVRRGDLLAKLRKPASRKKITRTPSGGPNLVEADFAEQGILPAEP